MVIGTTGFLVPNVYNSTTANSANVWVQSDGRMFRDNSSSARLKHNIKPFLGGGILGLTAKEYDFQPEEIGSHKVNGVGVKNKNPTKQGPLQHTVGFILEDVVEVYPAAVTHDMDGKPDGLNWKAITTGLLAEMQRMDKRLEKLEAQLAHA